MTARLEARSLVKRFGGLAAVDGVSISVDDAEIVGLIGPNGSGKTTLLSLLAGTLRPTSGSIAANGRSLSGGPRTFVRSGITRTFQSTRIFHGWTLRESMRLARRERPASEPSGDRDVGEDIAELLGLSDALDTRCGSLTSADRRRAMIASALSTGPTVLMLDEPAVGFDHGEAEALGDAIRRVRGELGISVIVVDHNMHFLMPVADRVIVMAMGSVLATGTPAEVRADQSVIASYLGA